ncbi:MAG: type II secretion system protein [Parcubacteria group bacterium]|nr:type II secretion system protein [Parcubacteria group bacterium]
MKIQNSKFKIQNFRESAGFTLVESLVAISIVLVSVVGPLTIISKTLSFARFARDEITAFYLTQDAAEFVRNTRDNSIIAGEDWLADLSACVGGVCAVDPTAGIIFSCGVSCDPLKLSSSGVYGYTNGNNTIFTREITIDETSGNREATIDVTLRWRQGLAERNFTIREYIFNWQ